MARHTIALLPFATPHVNFKTWGVFHPATIPYSTDRKRKNVDENTDYSGFASVKAAAAFSHTIVATIPPLNTVAGQALKELLSTYVDTKNVLAEVECLVMDARDASIASQVDRVMEEYGNSGMSITVVMPYQIFNLDEPFEGKGEASFAYSHAGLNVDRTTIPEGIGIYTADESESSATFTSCGYYNELDEIVKGNYTKILSAIEIDRDEWVVFKGSEDYPNFAKFAGKSLARKRGILTNPKGNGFI